MFTLTKKEEKMAKKKFGHTWVDEKGNIHTIAKNGEELVSVMRKTKR